MEWKAYELMPEGRPRPTLEQLKKGFESFKRTAAKEGLQVNFNPHFSSSRLALEGAKYAQEKGKFEAYNQRLFEAQFVKSMDIADLDVLTNIAEDAGLDRHDFRSAMEERRMKEAVEADLAEAKRLEVMAVPTFFIGESRIVGAQPEEAFIKKLGVRPLTY